jgi:hypothetical protein
MARNRGEQVLVYVPVTVNNYKYGFKTNDKKFKGVGAALGQKTALGVVGVFYGANSPKPGTARKVDKTGTISSYFDQNKAKELQKEGWILLSSGSSQGIRTSGLAVTVAVDTPFGYKYAWNITKAEVPLFSPFGVEVPTDADKLVFGSYPKPPRATKRTSTGSTSSFIAPDLAVMNQANLAGFSVTAADPDWGLA